MNILNRFTIGARVNFLAGATIVLLLFSGLFALRSLHQADESIEELYLGGLTHSQYTAKVAEVLNEINTQVLLALQHDPAGHSAALHDHPIQLHLDKVGANLEKIEQVWGKLAKAELTAAEQQSVEQFQQVLGKLKDQEWANYKQAITDGNYPRATDLAIHELKQTLDDAETIANGMLGAQVVEAKGIFERALKNFNSNVYTLAGIMVIAVVLSAVVALAIRRAISTAVNTLDHAASEIAAGNLGVRLEYPGNDELRHLANSVERIRSDFATTVNGVRDAVSQIAAAAEQTSTISSETQQGISTQRTDTEQVATAMNEMNATVHDVARNANETAEAARIADQSASHGRSVVQKAIATIDQLASEVGNASDVISRVRQDSEQIGSVLDVIRGIAEQTNLLALNAAIEAARAGEQGRGFAVVADEVRTLASRTQSSTSEIQEMISRLQAGAAEAVHVMETGSQQASSSVEHAGDAGKALEDISSAVDKISGMSTQIAAAVEEQSAVSEEINHNVHNISNVAMQTEQGAEQNAAAAAELARLANSLQLEVSRFRV